MGPFDIDPVQNFIGGISRHSQVMEKVGFGGYQNIIVAFCK